MPFPNRAGSKPKVDYEVIAAHWLWTKKHNPHYTKSDCARFFNVHRNTVVNALKAKGLFQSEPNNE